MITPLDLAHNTRQVERRRSMGGVFDPDEARRIICAAAVQSVKDLYGGTLEVTELAKRSPQYLAPSQTALGEVTADVTVAVTVGWVNVNGSGKTGYWIAHLLVTIKKGERHVASVGLHTTSNRDSQNHNPGRIVIDWVNYRVDPATDSLWGLVCLNGDSTW